MPRFPNVPAKLRRSLLPRGRVTSVGCAVETRKKGDVPSGDNKRGTRFSVLPTPITGECGAHGAPVERNERRNRRVADYRPAGWFCWEGMAREGR